MFFLMTLQKDVEVAPRFCGPNLHQSIGEILRQSMEGSCDPHIGWIVTVLSEEKKGKGRIMEDGMSRFHVTYKAVIFRPFKGEVMDCVVTTVSQLGVHAESGPLLIHISRDCMFPGMKFIESDGENFYESDERVRIGKGTELRVRIIGVKFNNYGFIAVGTIKEEYLGPLV